MNLPSERVTDALLEFWSFGKPPVYSCRPPRGFMFLYLRAEQTLSVIGILQVYFGADTEITAIPYPL